MTPILAMMVLAAAANQQCQYSVGYGLQAYKLVDGAWSVIAQGSFVQPGVPIRFRGWVSVGPNGCDACCARISFNYRTGQGVCNPSPTWNWQDIGTMRPISAGQMWEWTSPTYIPETYIVLGYFLIDGVQSAGLTRTYGPSQHFYVRCTGDVTGDLKVNVNDLLAVINNWSDLGGCGDANHDGIVNLADLQIVLENWGACY